MSTFSLATGLTGTLVGLQILLSISVHYKHTCITTNLYACTARVIYTGKRKYSELLHLSLHGDRFSVAVEAKQGEHRGREIDRFSHYLRTAK